MNDSPFLLDNSRAYQAWRARKLAGLPRSIQELRVEIADMAHLSALERSDIISACRRANLAVFHNAAGVGDKEDLRAFGRALGLERLDANLYADDDGITALQVSEVERKREFIPYTNQRLSWHTDGYYNTPERQIRGLLMFCVRDAAEGGENQLLDHEIAYILLRDADPRFIEALMHPQAMTIPANVEQGVEIRAAEVGPVFAIEPGTGILHMRYSARTKNIQWRDDPLTKAAVEYLQNLWKEGSEYVYHYRLMPGEGVICNNVLHNRTAFRDDPINGQTRLVYRARYFDRIVDTNFSDIYGASVSSL